jgi:fumarate reductase flavoprotein subunit
MKKTLSLLLVFALMLTLGVVGFAADEQTLNGAADGRNGPIEVEVVMVGDEIVSVTVVSQSETEGIGSVAITEIPAAIVDEQSILLDAVSGATYTSNGVSKSIRAALQTL